MPEGWRPRGVTPCPRTRAAKNARLQWRRNGREELPNVRGQGQKLERPHARGVAAKRSYPTLRSGQWPRVPGCDGTGSAKWSYPTSEARGGSREELPPARGQGQRPRGATPSPRSGGCVGAGGPRGATPCSRSGGMAVRRYPSYKVRSSGCTLLEQL